MLLIVDDFFVITSWEARLDQIVDQQQLAVWNKLSGLKMKLKTGLITRRKVLTKIYKSFDKQVK